MNGTLLVTCRQMQTALPRHIDRLHASGYAVLAPDLGERQQFTAAELLSFAPRITGIIAGDDELDREFFAGAAPHLRAVVRWGIGMDSVDFEAAEEYNVPVRNTPGVFGDEVADSAMAYLLAIARGIADVDRRVRAGEWPKHEGVTLAGSTIGIVGLGAIGRQVARRAEAFGMRVIGYDPYPPAALEGVEVVPLHELVSAARFVVLCCPLTETTHHLVDAAFLDAMGDDAFLVNVARGPVVDEAALAVALTEGHIAGAALDVFETEPLPSDSPLRRFSNVILGAHNGSNTRQGVERASTAAVDILLTELSS